MKLTDNFDKEHQKSGLIDFQVGDTIRVFSRIKEGDKERLQSFEGLVIAKKHGTGMNATFTVRKVSDGIGVERVFPLHSPIIGKIEFVKKSKVRRAKLYFTRSTKSKKMRTLTGKKSAATKTEEETEKSAE